jgi:FAD/FMN-containing dehydrogenase
MLAQAAISKFRQSLRGQSFCPGDHGYDLARTIPNAMIDRYPAIIARCAGVADVIECVRFARERDLLVSIRGGGHSVAGKSVCEGGLMIDMSGMKGMGVDPEKKIARAETGLTLGEFDRETQAFGLATTLGVVSKTGIAGLTLGGGWGHLHAKQGLALDNIISADVVTAEGKFLAANAHENEDLFWGVRGGGGNFGVVTSLEYKLYERGPVLAGAVFHPAAKAEEVLRFFRDFSQNIPDELVIQCGSFTTPDNTRVFAIAACYCGDLSEGEKLLMPLRKFGSPLADAISVMSYLQLQSMFDPFFPPGRHTYVKSNFIRELNDDAVRTITDFAGKSPSPYSFAPFVEHWHGAATRIAVAHTAFPHRRHSYNLMFWSNWGNPAEAEENIRWTRMAWNTLQPYLIEGSYVNYVSDEGDSFARAAYGPNYERLVRLKDKYDPTNFFRMNQNIKPNGLAREAMRGE